MNKRLRAVREFKPFDGQIVNRISYSPSSENFLICCGGKQAKIYHKEGKHLKTTMSGDSYISDLSNTKGHTAGISDG